jgi:hypothetical protein
MSFPLVVLVMYGVVVTVIVMTFVCVCVCVCARARACVRVRERVSESAHVGGLCAPPDSNTNMLKLKESIQSSRQSTNTQATQQQLPITKGYVQKQIQNITL